MTDVKDRVISALNDMDFANGEALTEATSYEELGLDSLDHVEIIMLMEETFAISIDDEAAEKFKTVGDLITYIQGRDDIA